LANEDTINCTIAQQTQDLGDGEDAVGAAVCSYLDTESWPKHRWQIEWNEAWNHFGKNHKQKQRGYCSFFNHNKEERQREKDSKRSLKDNTSGSVSCLDLQNDK